MSVRCAEALRTGTGRVPGPARRALAPVWRGERDRSALDSRPGRGGLDARPYGRGRSWNCRLDRRIESIQAGATVRNPAIESGSSYQRALIAEGRFQSLAPTHSHFVKHRLRTFSAAVPAEGRRRCVQGTAAMNHCRPSRFLPGPDRKFHPAEVSGKPCGIERRTSLAPSPVSHDVNTEPSAGRYEPGCTEIPV